MTDRRPNRRRNSRVRLPDTSASAHAGDTSPTAGLGGDARTALDQVAAPIARRAAVEALGLARERNAVARRCSALSGDAPAAADLARRAGAALDPRAAA